MMKDCAYDHGWAEERIRLAGLETALDPGTRFHMTRLSVGPGNRCLEIGAGGGSVAFTGRSSGHRLDGLSTLQ